MTTVTFTHSCAQKFARMRIINPMLRSRDFLLLFWTFGLFRPLPLSWWRLEISPLETFSSGRRFNRRAGHFFPTHLNGLTRSKFSSASCGFTPFLRPSFCNPPLSCHFYLPLGRTYNYPSLYLLGGRFYNFLKFPNGKQNPKKSWGATCIPFDSEVHLFSCCVFKHLHWDFVWKWEEWMSPGRGCQRHNSVWVVEWTKPTVETRAEKLGMKLENESRVEKQPRTVENSRESWEKVEKVQNNFKNESWEQKLRKKLRSWEKVEKSWEQLRMKVDNKSWECCDHTIFRHQKIDRWWWRVSREGLQFLANSFYSFLMPGGIFCIRIFRCYLWSRCRFGDSLAELSILKRDITCLWITSWPLQPIKVQRCHVQLFVCCFSSQQFRDNTLFSVPLRIACCCGTFFQLFVLLTTPSSNCSSNYLPGWPG